jgi:hypothetical protein
MRPIELLVRTATALLAAVFFALPAAAADLFTLRDPRGDDHGDGSLIYPLNEELDPGDLDLVSLTAGAGKGGTWFEATFARPVRVPEAEVVDDLGTSLKSVARFGFYTFNLDIYIDTDRVPGSGAVAMMPGRKAEVDPASAWERAVILTPTPGQAQSELKTLITKSALEARQEERERGLGQRRELRQEIGLDLEERVFFPVRTRVRGRTIRFFVPAAFLGGPAEPGWSYVVAVTGADIAQSFDLGAAAGLSDPRRENLMAVPVSPGRRHDRFGGGVEGEELQPPLIDVIVPEGRFQETLLRDFRSAEDRPARLLGVVPAEVKGG